MEKGYIHIGELIRMKAKEKNIRPTEFAKLMGYSLPGATDIFKRATMQTDVLQEVCRVLEYDFFKDYSTTKGNDELVELNKGLVKELEETRKENAALRLEMEYLKKINKLLER